MEIKDLKRILISFADKPGDIDMDKGNLLLQVRDEVIEASIFLRDARLMIKEGDEVLTAESWIVNRVARLPLLAERILSYIPPETNFVVPAATLVDQLEVAPEEGEVNVEDAILAAREVLDRRPAFTSSVLYLTSDAGEGKTTLINELARRQAAAYKRKEVDWLLVPVPLGGRPFLRFDDVVIAALVNRLRFQLLYFDSFVELVRLGVLVPAFDGFEEMFVEGPSGEAVSALGNLMQTLDSQGSVLIAARKAYYEYENFEAQARLFDALVSGSVSFAKLGLRRWDRQRFLAYCRNRAIDSAEAIYEAIGSQLGAAHPLLTRAVLVRRLVDVGADSEGRADLLERITGHPETFFAEFVETIVAREAHEKWINKDGDPARPLISLAEHHLLLGDIAQEMWINNTESLGGDVVTLVAELFCERLKKPASVSRQVIERTRNHALIVRHGGPRETFAFDHQEFYHHFLGESVERLVSEASLPELRSVLRRGPLPIVSLEGAVYRLRERREKVKDIVRTLGRVANAEGPASSAKENIGGLVVRLLNRQKPQEIEVAGAIFGMDSLVNLEINGVGFRQCYFQPTSLKNVTLRGCRFADCDFERLELSDSMVVDNVSFVNCRCASVAKGETQYFDPCHVALALRSAGFALDDEIEPLTVGGIEARSEEDLLLTQKAIRQFLRATEINENILRVKFGNRAGYFMTNILPRLLEVGVLREVEYHGAGVQRRFRLGRKQEEIREALFTSGGEFGKFVNSLEASAKTG